MSKKGLRQCVQIAQFILSHFDQIGSSFWAQKRTVTLFQIKLQNMFFIVVCFLSMEQASEQLKTKIYRTGNLRLFILFSQYAENTGAYSQKSKKHER